MSEPRAFYIRNHSASELHATELAKLPTLSERPQFASKDEYAKWCHDSGTDHVFYYMVEPEQPGFRPSGANPAKFLHGIVADYDGAPEAINAALPHLKFGPGKAPTWVTKTFSNKARLIWVFEKPVPTFTPEVFTRFMDSMVKDLKLKSLLPGLDEAIFNPYTPYELGTEWRQPYGDVRIPHSVVMLALHDASNKAKWKPPGVEIPIEAIRDEVEKRWPGRWKGNFEVGAQGVRFWCPTADNQTGAWIREHGVQAFTGECRYLPWTELLGEDFVKQYRANRIGGAIDGTYFDGHEYWQRDGLSIWRSINSEAIKRHLNVLHGLSSETKKGVASELAQAITTIDRMQRVDGAFPCLFMKADTVHDGPSKYLNISRAKPISHGPVAREWGDGFPWLASYFNGLFDEHQLNVFLSWLSHFYKNAVAGHPKKGQALFIAGPQSAGKTFLSQRVVGGLMGGFQEATKYLLGDTQFNEELFQSPCWAVDDAVASADPKRHVAYSQMVKKIVANPYQEYHAKFKKAVTFRWNGRLIVTLNDDPTSIEMLPNIEGSMLDKVVILRASAPGVSFVGADDKCSSELPYFADFVAHFVIPEFLLTRPAEVARFGHDSWHHPELLTTARESSTSSGLKELLQLWREYHFRAVKDTEMEWKGSATELMGDMSEMDRVKNIVKTVAPNMLVFSRDLRKIIAQGCDWLAYGRSNGGRVYTIKRPEVVAK